MLLLSRSYLKIQWTAAGYGVLVHVMDDLTEIPEFIIPGTTVRFHRQYSDFPASAGWALSLRMAGAAVLAADGVPDGDSFLFTLPTTDTQGLTAGNYRWEERASIGDEVYVAGSGTLAVLQDIGAAVPGSFQTFNEQMLACVEAIIKRRWGAGLGVTPVDPPERYGIDTRTVELMPNSEILNLRASLYRAVLAERNGGQFAQVQVRFPGLWSESMGPWPWFRGAV
jgi:hypothetical protein